MTRRVVVMVLDWDWNYLGHEFLFLSEDEVNRMPVGKVDSINLAVTRRIAPTLPDGRCHTALCIVGGTGDLDIERASNDLRERHGKGDYDSRTETFLDAAGAIKAYNVLKRGNR